MEQPIRLMIRADAGPNMGTGHVLRCLALGQAWKRLGGQVDFACGALPAKLSHQIKSEKFHLFPIRGGSGSAADARDTNELIHATQPDWIVLDGYRFTDNYQANIQLGSSKLICIDDFGHALHERAHAILNQNVYAVASDYPGSNAAEVITGPKFALLRKEFSQKLAGDLSVKPQRLPVRARRILVTFGGSDANNITARVLHALNQCAVDRTSVDVILGPCYAYHDSLQEIAKQSPAAMRIHCNVDRMQPLMERAHLAITAGGSTCYELARCGIPSVVIPIADNQIPLARTLAEFGAVHVLPQQDQLDENSLCRTLSRIIRDPAHRRSMSRVGRQLIDGQGANRLARRLASQLYNFRSAEPEDAPMTLRWRNDPEVRAICFRDNVIPLDDHQRWFNSKIRSSRAQIQIIESRNGTPLGQVRLDFDWAKNEALISINLVPSMRGRGMGTAFIERVSRDATRKRPGLRILAQIKTTNLASQTSFRKAGYRSMATTTVNGQVALQYAYEAETVKYFENAGWHRRAS